MIMSVVVSVVRSITYHAYKLLLFKVILDHFLNITKSWSHLISKLLTCFRNLDIETMTLIFFVFSWIFEIRQDDVIKSDYPEFSYRTLSYRVITKEQKMMNALKFVSIWMTGWWWEKYFRQIMKTSWNIFPQRRRPLNGNSTLDPHEISRNYEKYFDCWNSLILPFRSGGLETHVLLEDVLQGLRYVIDVNARDQSHFMSFCFLPNSESWWKLHT